jgi:elongation factor P
MVKAGTIDKGMYLLLRDEPHLVTEREHVNPGKGQAFVRLRLRNVKTGQVLRETIKAHEQVQEADVYDQDGQYLYSDDGGFHFMDTDTYEQFTIPAEGLDDKRQYMKEGETYRLIMWNDTPVDITLPLKETYTVTEAPEALRGDTVSNATKPVTVETGLRVKAPLFIKEGDKIVVSTQTGEYVERASDQTVR